MKYFYCENCGHKSTSITTLTSSSCKNHPNGNLKGKHSLYQGTEKSRYTCKLCGIPSSSIATLTMSSCKNHPNGALKGKHQPAL